MKLKFLAAAAAATAAIAIALFFFLREPAAGTIPENDEETAVESGDGEENAPRARKGRTGSGEEDETSSDGEEEPDDSASDDADDEEPEQNEPEDPEEKAVDEFDAATDSWMESKTVTMDDVYKFAASFKKVPQSRKEECLQRALNLIPDDNVMLLAGILMDKSLPTEFLEAVFNDVLNRSEDVKKPILDLIYKDKSHHCWADVAWIKDVTGSGEAGDGNAAGEEPADEEEQAVEEQ